MSFPDITSELRAAMPALRGRLLANQRLAELTWFRVGGPAQVLFTPADADDLAAAGIDPRLRAEQLAPATFVALAQHLQAKG